MTETILLVEDEPGLAQSLQKEFQFEGYQVILAGDGEQAVAEFEKFQAEISLVILDWMLPKLDGLGVLRRIRRISEVPVIMLTARDYAGDKVSGLKSGADDYVTSLLTLKSSWPGWRRSCAGASRAARKNIL